MTIPPEYSSGMSDEEILAIVKEHEPNYFVCRCGKCRYAFAEDDGSAETSFVAEELIAALIRYYKEKEGIQ